MTLQPAAGGQAPIRHCTCARAMRETARLSVFEKESEDCLYVWVARNFACGITKIQGRGSLLLRRGPPALNYNYGAGCPGRTAYFSALWVN